MKQKINWIEHTNINTILNFRDTFTVCAIMRKTGETANPVRNMLRLLESNDFMTSTVNGRERHYFLTKKGKSLQREFSKFTAVLREL